MRVKQPRASTMPGAWICSTTDRGRKSIKNGKVYLNDNTEFLIELYNPLTSCILCDIKLNGQSVSSSGLVLRPGQRFYLDCFPDDKKKFVFKTYEVENSNESREAIAKNGLLEVRFFKEEVVNIPNYPKVIERHYHHYDYYPVYRSYPYWYGSTLGGSLTTGGSNCIGSTLTIGSTFNSNNTSYASFDANSANYCSSVDLSNVFGSLSSTPISNNIETGRVEKGSSSSQQFTEVDMQFQSMCITSVVLQILPESRRPIDTRDIIQPKHKEEIRNLMNNTQATTNFCENCGNKLKGSENFCPSCGKKIK